ncbi:MAG: hypothetical protein OXC69_07260, partial [Candidatus Tectomicrobia bacterium]|nr:hypothetical protein [Candidatus Tectomicrobia bacterium]
GQSLEAIVAEAYRNSVHKEQTRVIREAIGFAASELGVAEGGCIGDEQQRREFARLVVKRVKPWLLHLMGFPREGA